MSERAGPVTVRIEDIAPPRVEPSKAPDDRTQIELYKAMTAGQIDKKSRLQDIDERKAYAAKIFWLVSAWLFAVFVLLLCAGAQRLPFVLWPPSLVNWPVALDSPRFFLSDKVLISVVAGTTVDLIGVFIVVIKYLFPPPPTDSKKPQPRTRKKDAD